MIEVRWHGRGGQGAVKAAEMVARAAIAEGRYAQAFPSFGPERRGAPVLSFNRIDEKPIWTRSEIYRPDVIVILDPTLIKRDVTDGLKPDGMIVINTAKNLEEMKKFFQGFKLALVDARRIALDTLGVPIVNTAMVGAFAKATNLVRLESLHKAIDQMFEGEVAEKNMKATTRAYQGVVLG